MDVCVHSFKKKEKAIILKVVIFKVRAEGVIRPGYKCVYRTYEINNYAQLHEALVTLCISVFLATLESQGPCLSSPASTTQ